MASSLSSQVIWHCHGHLLNVGIGFLLTMSNSKSFIKTTIQIWTCHFCFCLSLLVSVLSLFFSLHRSQQRCVQEGFVLLNRCNPPPFHLPLSFALPVDTRMQVVKTSNPCFVLFSFSLLQLLITVITFQTRKTGIRRAVIFKSWKKNIWGSKGGWLRCKMTLHLAES